MGKKSELGDMLSMLSLGVASNKTGPESMGVEMDDKPTPTELSRRRSELLKIVDPEEIDPTDRKTVDAYFKEVMDNIGSLSDEYDELTDIAGFTDLAIDSLDDLDSDYNYKNTLIGGGRKYARATSTGGEDSEVTRAFAAQYAALSELMRNIDTDKREIDKDLYHVRGLRTRNYKAIADLVTAKASLHGHTMAAIKELNAMAKTQFDIKNKMAANDSTDADMVSTRAMQSIFGMGRKALVDGNGGMDNIAGYDYDAVQEKRVQDVMLMDDDQLVERYGGYDDESDGNLFTKYENAGVEYVVEFDESGDYNIYAEDKDGNRVDDYPLPSTEGLNFTINRRTNTATDQLQRKYKVRNV